ncbi:MAG TPA: SgcJ/EcaC family oxidoreductase, partial [Isosphaeraceae bacterium]
MKTAYPALLGLLLVAHPLLAADGPAVDEKAVRGAIDAFAQAFARGDAKALAGLFTENGEAVDLDGEAIQGREALEAHYAGRFADAPGGRLETGVESIKPLAHGIVTVTGRSRV